MATQETRVTDYGKRGQAIITGVGTGTDVVFYTDKKWNRHQLQFHTSCSAGTATVYVYDNLQGQYKAISGDEDLTAEGVKTFTLITDRVKVDYASADQAVDVVYNCWWEG